MRTRDSSLRLGLGRGCRNINGVAPILGAISELGHIGPLVILLGVGSLAYFKRLER